VENTGGVVSVDAKCIESKSANGGVWAETVVGAGQGLQKKRILTGLLYACGESRKA